MRLIDAEPIERKLFKEADKSLAKNPYEKARICAFRQAFEMILSAPTVPPLPNNPLTLDELRGMDGEPVFLTPIQSAGTDGKRGAWALVDLNQRMCRVSGGGLAVFENCGKTWLAYRRRPEEAEHE